jgi:hypothetical protein
VPEDENTILVDEDYTIKDNLTETSLDISNLELGLEYIFKIKTINPIGESTYQTLRNVMVAPPNSVSNLKITGTTTSSLTLKWDLLSGEDLGGSKSVTYDVWKKINDG